MQQQPLPLWRVRVRMSVENWLEIPAATAREAEAQAATRPHVLQVLTGSSVRGEKRADRPGIQENLFNDDEE